MSAANTPSLSMCPIAYDAPAVLHERVRSSPARCGVQYWRGGSIAQGTLGQMLRRALSMPSERFENVSITVDDYAAAGNTFIECADIVEISERADFPRRITRVGEFVVDLDRRVVLHTSGASVSFYEYESDDDWLRCGGSCHNARVFPGPETELVMLAKAAAVAGGMKMARDVDAV